MNHCYWFSSIRRNWGEAEEYCKKENGHLASITDSRIHDYIRSKVHPNHYETWFWVGGTDQRHENNWKWADGSPWKFTKWADKQPSNGWPSIWEFSRENCLQITKEGWNDNACNNQIRFVCSQQICPLTNPSDPSTNNENNQENDETNASNTTSDPPVKEVAIPCGVFLIVIVIVIIICVMRKRSKKNQEVMKTDENQVYGVYQLSDTYERQYSTSEAVDYNDYYGK